MTEMMMERDYGNTKEEPALFLLQETARARKLRQRGQRARRRRARWRHVEAACACVQHAALRSLSKKVAVHTLLPPKGARLVAAA